MNGTMYPSEWLHCKRHSKCTQKHIWLMMKKGVSPFQDVLTIVIVLTIRKIIYEDEQTVLTTNEKNLFNQYKELYSKLDKEN